MTAGASAGQSRRSARDGPPCPRPQWPRGRRPAPPRESVRAPPAASPAPTRRRGGPTRSRRRGGSRAMHRRAPGAGGPARPSPCRQGRRRRRAPPPPRGQDAGRRTRPAGSGPPAPPRRAPPAGPTRPCRPRPCAGARPAPRGGPDRPALPAPRAARQAGVRCRSPRNAATAPPAPAPPAPATGRRSPNRSCPPPTGPPPAGRRSAHCPRGSRERRGPGAAASQVRGPHRPFRARRTGRAGVARTAVPEIPRCPSQHTSARWGAGVGATTKAAAAIARQHGRRGRHAVPAAIGIASTAFPIPAPVFPVRPADPGFSHREFGAEPANSSDPAPSANGKHALPVRCRAGERACAARAQRSPRSRPAPRRGGGRPEPGGGRGPGGWTRPPFLQRQMETAR